MEIDCTHLTGWVNPKTNVQECYTCAMPWGLAREDRARRGLEPGDRFLTSSSATTTVYVETKTERMFRLRREIEKLQAEIEFLK